MSIFKRLTTTVFSRVDHMVNQIENHDAVVEAAIKDARRATAKAKIRLNKIQSDGRKLKFKLTEQQQTETQWITRAKTAAEDNEIHAIECLRRRKSCQVTIRQLTESLEDHVILEKRLQQDVKTSEEVVSKMIRQQNMMRARESTAEALSSMSSINATATTNVEETFDRWEMQVTEAEIEAGTTDTTDTFESDFINDEEQASLRDELAELLKNKESGQ